MLTDRRRLLLAAASLAFAARLDPAAADTWPNRPVKIIAPFAPGGAADLFARLLAEHFTTAFKQPFIVETRPGAGGMIGSADVARSEPDGAMLVISGNASHILAPAFSPAPSYDGVADFTHIAFLGGAPVGLVVHPSLPVNSYAEFVAYVKRSPTPLDYTSSGYGTHGFLFGEELARIEGLRLDHIPYKGGGAAMVDLVGGHVKIATITFSSVIAQVQAAQLKALAVSSERRLPSAPDVPTFAESGHPDMVSSSWFALSGPRGLPRDIVEQLNRQAEAVLALPDVQALLQRTAIETKPMSPDETAAFFANETAHWAPLARSMRAVENEK